MDAVRAQARAASAAAPSSTAACVALDSNSPYYLDLMDFLAASPPEQLRMWQEGRPGARVDDARRLGAVPYSEFGTAATALAPGRAMGAKVEGLGLREVKLYRAAEQGRDAAYCEVLGDDLLAELHNCSVDDVRRAREADGRPLFSNGSW